MSLDTVAAGRILGYPLSGLLSQGGALPVSPWHCVVTVCPLLPLSEGEKDFPSRRCVCSVHAGSSFPLGEPSAVHWVTCRALGDLAMSELQGHMTVPLENLALPELRSPLQSSRSAGLPWQQEALSPGSLPGWCMV